MSTIKHIVGVQDRKTEVIATGLMRPGDIGEIVTSFNMAAFAGSFLLRTYNEFVLLNEPIHTWPQTTDLGMVKLLPPGTVLKIRIGERS